MFASSIKINGVEIPKEFSRYSQIIGGVVISEDESQFAAVDKRGNVITGAVPPDRKITIDGKTITVQESARGSIVTGSISVTGDGISITVGDDGPERNAEVEETFDGAEQVVVASTGDGAIRLEVQDGPGVGVSGRCTEKPSFRSGVLDLGDFDGVIKLPSSGALVALATEMGDISGELALSGKVSSRSGKITLAVKKSVSLDAETGMKGLTLELHDKAVLTGELFSKSAAVTVRGDGSVAKKIATGMGDVTVEIEGECRSAVETRSGKVKISANAIPDANIETGMGAITVSSKGGINGTIRSKSGNLDITGGGDVSGSFETGSGNLTLRAGGAFQGGTITTRNGNITATFADHANADVTDGMGNISLTAAKGLAGTVKTEMGSVKVDLNGKAPVTVRTKTQMGRVNVSGMVNEKEGVYVAPDQPCVKYELSITTKMGGISVSYR